MNTSTFHLSDSLTTGLAALTLNNPSQDTKESEGSLQNEADMQRDFSRLFQLGLIDQSATVWPGANFGTSLPKELQNKLRHFLNDSRSTGHSILTILRAILKPLQGKCYLPVLLGQELPSILGLDFLLDTFRNVLKQKDSTLTVENCLSEDTLDFARVTCQKAARNLTIRIPLLEAVANPISLIEPIHQTLQCILKGSLSPLRVEQTLDFYYESTIDGVNQRVHFEFQTPQSVYDVTSGTAVQLLLTPEFLDSKGPPLFIDNHFGNQWCIDTLLKIIRVITIGHSCPHTMFEYLRSGYDLSGHARCILQDELKNLDMSTLQRFWQTCTDCYETQSERLAQNILYLCQLTSTFAASDDEKYRCAQIMESFIEQTLGAIKPSASPESNLEQSFWHACIALIKDRVVTYTELESLLQVFGISACTIRQEGNVHFRCTSLLTTPMVSIESKAKNAKCIFQVPLNLPKALETFQTLYPRVCNHAGIITLIDHIFKGPFKQTHMRPALSSYLKPILPQLEAAHWELGQRSFIPRLLLSTVSDNTIGFTSSLRELLATRRSSTPQQMHVIEKILQVGFVGKGLELPSHFQNGGLSSDDLEHRWIDYLLSTQEPLCETIGQRLLLEVDGHCDLKCKWIGKSLKKHPEFALRLISQVKDENEVTEAHIKKWLHTDIQNTRILVFDLLVTSPSGRWLASASVTCPTHVQEAFNSFTLNTGPTEAAKRLVSSISTLKAVAKDEYRSLILFNILQTDRIACWASEVEAFVAVLESTEVVLSKKEKAHLRAILGSFTAKACELNLYTLAVRFMKVYVTHECGKLDPESLSLLVLCAQHTLPQELAQWYLRLSGTVIAAKLAPAEQVRGFLQITKDHSALIQATHSTYMTKLHALIEPNVRALLQNEIKALSIDSTIDVSNESPFKVFFTVEKVKKQVAKVGAKTAERQPQVKPQAQTRAQPHKELTAADILRNLQNLANSLSNRLYKEICTLLHSRKSMSDSVNRQIWGKIFENPQWLNSAETLVVFREIDFFSSLFSEPADTTRIAKRHQKNLADIIKVLVAILKENPKSVTQYFTFVYQWFQLLPEEEPDILIQKMSIGLEILQLCTPSHDVKVVQIAGKCMGHLLPHLDKITALKATQPRKNALDLYDAALSAITVFVQAALSPQAVGATEQVVLDLINTLTSQRSEKYEKADRFVVSQFCSHPSQAVKEALWPAVKRLSPQILAPQTVTAGKKLDLITNQVIESLHHLLQTTNIELLLSIFESQFEVDETQRKEQRKIIGAIPQFTQNLPRLFRLCIESTVPQHSVRALIIDCNIRQFYGKQAQAIWSEVLDYGTLRLDLLLKMIQYNDWSDVTKKQFHRVISLDLRPILGSRIYDVFFTKINSPRFYPYPLAESQSRTRDESSLEMTQENPEGMLGSLCPTNCSGLSDDKTSMPVREYAEVTTCITAGLRFAKDGQTTEVQKIRLLNFTLQTIRNMMEHHPGVHFHFEIIKAFYHAVQPNEHTLWSRHCDIVFCLLRSAIRKNITTPEHADVQEMLKSIQKSTDDLVIETLAPIESIKNALNNINEENAAGILFEQQQALLMWQERDFVDSYQVRQDVIDRFFALWGKFPSIRWNKKVLQSIAPIFSPNSVRFGQNDGLNGHIAALTSLESYLNCYISFYKSTVQSTQGGYDISTERKGVVRHQFSIFGKFAASCLQNVTDEINNAAVTGCYRGNYDVFIRHAKNIIPLFANPCYLGIISISQIVSNFTDTLLTPVLPCEEEQRAIIVYDWLECLYTHKGKEEFAVFITPIVRKILVSDVCRHFNKNYFRLIVSCLNHESKKQLITYHKRLLSGLEIQESSLDCLFAIYEDIQSQDKQGLVIHDVKYAQNKGPVTVTITQNGEIAICCLQVIAETLLKEATTNSARFLKYMPQMFTLLSKPCYLGIKITSTHSLELVVSSVCAYVACAPSDSTRVALLHSWLSVVATHKDDAGYIDLLELTMDSLIRRKLLTCFGFFTPEQNKVLFTFLQDWQTCVRISEELTQLLKEQSGLKFLQALDHLKSCDDIDAELVKQIKAFSLEDN